MKRTNQKIMALILTILIIATNLISLGNQVIAANLTEQNSSTNNKNVTFDSYLEGNVHTKKYSVEEDAKLYLKINVNNTGYLKNSVITISNTANYEIDTSNINNELILSATENQITLKQINAGKQETIQVPIKIKTANKVEKDFAEKVSQVSLNAVYIDSEGKELNITKTIENKVIWEANSDLELNYEVSKYVPYSQNEEYGVLLQTKISSNLKDHILPILKTELTMVLPQIENVKPTSVNVIANQTTNTNNDENGNSFNNTNYNYEEETGKLTIVVSNIEDENNLISLNQNGVDEYYINCIYNSKELYEKLLQKPYEAQMEVTGKVTLANMEQTELTKTIEVKYNEKETIGSLTDIAVIVPDSISKGNMYANYDKNEDQIETNYEYSYKTQINALELTNKIQMQTMPDYYLDEKENEYPIENNSYIKQIKINKDIFEKILGQDGSIQISKTNKESIGTINKDITLENNYYILDISDSNVQDIQIQTSKPQNVGNFEIKILKAIVGNQTYEKAQIKDFKQLKVGAINQSIEEPNSKIENTISLKEPINKAEINIAEGNENFSTIVKNENVEIRVVLDTSSTEYALYKDPVIEIELPSQVEEVNIKDINILLDDELEIKDKKVITKNNKQVIQLTLKGTQTKYIETVKTIAEKENVISKGANIIINTDITVNKFSASNEEKITMYYTNKNTNLYEASTNESTVRGIANTNINIVAPVGVSAINKMSGYNDSNSELITLNGEKQQATIPTNSAKRTVTVEGTVTNNYENNIENVFILGRLPFEGNSIIDGENLGSTFTMPMTRKIQLSGIDQSKVKIYYSTNATATKDLLITSNEWKENPENLSNVKSYLIAITGEVAKSTQITFNYQVELPANLSTDKSSYEMYKVYYDNKAEGATIGETKVAGVLGLATEKSPELEVTLSSNVKENSNVAEEQIVKFFASVKNIGKDEVKNVSVNVPIPSGAVYTIYDSSEQTYMDSEETAVKISVGNIAPNETKTISYELKMKTGAQETISNTVNVSADNIKNAITSNTYVLNKISAKAVLTLSVPRDLNTTLNKGDILESILLIEAREALNNVVVTLEIPNGIKINSASYFDKSLAEQNYAKIENNKVIVNIPSLEADYVQSLKVDLEIESFKGDFEYIAKLSSQEIEEQISNQLIYHVGSPEFEITQTTSAQRYLKEAKEITYEFTVKNIGDSDADQVIFEDILPNGLTFKKLEYTYKNKTQEISSTLDNTAKIRWTKFEKDATATIKITAQADLLDENKEDKQVSNVGSISADGVETKTSNSITTIIEYNQELYTGNEGNDNEINDETKYKITGTAWLDANQNGQREETEQILSGITVMLLRKSNSEVVKDLESGAEKTTTTSQNGTYEFENLAKGEYVIVFRYDAGKYNVTDYQKENISPSYNSDAISMLVTLNGVQTYAGVTDTIKIANETVRDIDIGLYEAKKFDLKLDKYISKITVSTQSAGTKVYNVKNSKLQKVEIFKKDVNKSNLVVEYKIVVTNEGQVPGYATKIVDYLPMNTRFNSEINTDWYISDNNSEVYNTSLENTLLQPGQSKEVTLILSAQVTDNNIGTIVNNNAEIYESYNEFGTKDIDSTEANMKEGEDDISKADIVLSVGTGTMVLYSALILAILFIIIIGMLIIKRKFKEEDIL